MRKKLIYSVLILIICGSLIFFLFVIWYNPKQRGVLEINFDKRIGEIKPLNGINNGPVSGYSNDSGNALWKLDVTELYQDMQIPYVRTHDTEYPYGQDLFIDIHCIFPDFSADVNSPQSYSFEETDEYISKIMESGAKVFFRLGESIDHSGENRYTRPPEDMKKWAEICEHIIRHYNEFWADGFAYNIVYWEIWNEPDSASMWRGNIEEYYELYNITASYLKTRYPDIKVGGGAFSAPTEESVSSFLENLKNNNVPIDFLSWHTYTNNPGKFAETGIKIRELLDKYGFTKTESILDEWNYLDGWDDQSNAIKVRQSVQGGAFIASSLIAMQYGSIDSAMYYDGQYEFIDIFCGLFDGNGNKRTGYYSFTFWGKISQLLNQVFAEGKNLSSIYYCAAASDSEKGILLVNYNENSVQIKVNLEGIGCIDTAEVSKVNEKYPDGISENKLFLFGSRLFTLDSGEIMYISFA